MREGESLHFNHEVQVASSTTSSLLNNTPVGQFCISHLVKHHLLYSGPLCKGFGMTDSMRKKYALGEKVKEVHPHHASFKALWETRLVPSVRHLY